MLSDESTLYLVFVDPNSHGFLPLETQPSVKPSAVIRETDNVAVLLRTNFKLNNSLLTIQDLELGAAEERRFQGYYEYWWRPPGGEYPGFFRNHFGQSTLRVVAETSVSGGSAEITELSSTVEVLATKLNAQRANDMLEYLEFRMEDITRSCFSVTAGRSSIGEADEKTAPVVLQHIRRNIESLLKNLFRFRDRKRSRVTQKPTVTAAQFATNINDRSIVWVLQHPDCLVPSHMSAPSSIRAQGKWFTISDLESDMLCEDTDVYENRVIAGYLESMAAALVGIQDRISDLLRTIEADDHAIQVPPGFESMGSIRRKFGVRFYVRVQNECSELQGLVEECRRFFAAFLPVRRVIRSLPDMSPGFLSTSHYRDLFEQITAWYRLGKLSIAGEQFVYGLRTLDKLYEFYCLYRQLEILESIGYKMTGTERPIDPSALAWARNPAYEYVCLEPDGSRIILQYQARITRHSADGLVDTKHFGGRYALWIPDFVIRVERGPQRAFAIIDAKYTRSSTALDKWLPELTMKYLHGIGNPAGGVSDVMALYIVHPRTPGTQERDASRSYHSRSYDIFSTTPAIPILGTVEATPDPSTRLPDQAGTDQFSRVLCRLIGIMRRERAMSASNA